MADKMVCFKCKWSGAKSEGIQDPDFKYFVSCPKCNGVLREVQYNEKIDPILYSDLTKDFASIDFIQLAFAALSQSNADQALNFDQLVEKLGVSLPWDDKWYTTAWKVLNENGVYENSQRAKDDDIVVGLAQCKQSGIKAEEAARRFL